MKEHLAIFYGKLEKNHW